MPGNRNGRGLPWVATWGRDKEHHEHEIPRNREARFFHEKRRFLA